MLSDEKMMEIIRNSWRENDHLAFWGDKQMAAIKSLRKAGAFHQAELAWPTESTLKRYDDKIAALEAELAEALDCARVALGLAVERLGKMKPRKGTDDLDNYIKIHSALAQLQSEKGE